MKTETVVPFSETFVQRLTTEKLQTTCLAEENGRRTFLVILVLAYGNERLRKRRRKVSLDGELRDVTNRKQRCVGRARIEPCRSAGILVLSDRWRRARLIQSNVNLATTSLRISFVLRPLLLCCHTSFIPSALFFGGKNKRKYI